MLITSLLCSLGLGACQHTRAVEPALSTVGSSYYCGRIEFTITSPTTVTPNWPDRPCNGNPPLPILSAGAMGWSEADSRTLTVPMRIINRGTAPVQTPVKMVLPVSGKTVLNPVDTPNSTMVPLNPDSTRADGAKVYLIGSTGTVNSGDSTAIRTLQFQINSPVIQGRLVFTITGETAAQFPAVAPDSVPSWFVNDSSWTQELWLKRVAAVRFTAGATIAQKQAAIDSVGGLVIGGTHLSNDPDGMYFIYVQFAANNDSLLAVFRILTRQPGVGYAGPHIRVVPTGLRPSDGANWAKADWTFFRDSAGGQNWNFEESSFPLAWGCQSPQSTPELG